jgi:hypothetical protein
MRHGADSSKSAPAFIATYQSKVFAIAKERAFLLPALVHSKKGKMRGLGGHQLVKAAENYAAEKSVKVGNPRLCKGLLPDRECPKP